MDLSRNATNVEFGVRILTEAPIYIMASSSNGYRTVDFQSTNRGFDSYGGCHFSNTLGEGNERSLTGKATALPQESFSSNLNQ